MAKKYYWLKLKEDFFRQKAIKKMRRIAGGDTYTIIYLKMQLLSLKDNGKLYYEGIEKNFAEEIALEIDEELENVQVTITFLETHGLLETGLQNEYTLNETVASIGGESESAERVRRFREKQKQVLLPESALHCNDDVTSSNTEKEIEKEKINIFFENMWKLYPSKKGKLAVKSTRRKELYKLGDELGRCINRYIADVEERRKTFKELNYQNGSTFFNGTYIDYLDKNYTDETPTKPIQPITGICVGTLDDMEV